MIDLVRHTPGWPAARSPGDVSHRTRRVGCAMRYNVSKRHRVSRSKNSSDEKQNGERENENKNIAVKTALQNAITIS